MRYKIIDNQKPCKPAFASTYSDESIIDAEEKTVVIDGLLYLTVQNKIQWTCTQYSPIIDIPADVNTKAYIWQNFVVESDFKNHHIQIELSEFINLPSGRGDLGLEFEPIWNKDKIYKVYLSDKYDNYNRGRVRSMQDRYKSDSLVRLINSIIPSITQSPAIEEGFEIRIVDSRYPDSIMNNKMFRLAKQLRNDRRVLDFHQCIFDINHREALYKEYGIT